MSVNSDLIFIAECNVEAEVTAEIATKAFPAADSNDKAAGSPHSAD
jgi:hypothetical protein